MPRLFIAPLVPLYLSQNISRSQTSTTPIWEFPIGVAGNGPLSVHGKSSGHSEMAESSSTPSEYRSHHLSVVESPNPCSGSASVNTSVTPKHNFSPPYGMIPSTGNSGPSSQHEHLVTNNVYSQLPSSFTCKPNESGLTYNFGPLTDNGGINHLRNNNYVATENGEFVCEVCRAVYSSRSSLQSHMKKHTNHVVKRHQCDQCPYSTQYGKNLFKHIESMHATDKSNQYRCEGCCRCFPTETMLRDHECLVAQCNAYRCNECGRVFKTKLRLKYHADIHNPRKPYVCDVEGCDRAFRTPKYLKNHRDEFHRMQPKNYICPVDGCDLIFHRKTHLKRHIATHDDAEKKYHCQWPNCQRRFCSEETLNLHYRKHTGEKPFNCALCQFSCYNKPSLNEHYRLQHAKDATVEGPYKSLSPHLSSPSVSHRLSTGTLHFGPPHPSEPATSQGRTSTPVPAVRHRMADILESCGAQPPGPLDAEINGILDSLDKESDLPDLFSSGTFDFEQSNPPDPPPIFRNVTHTSSSDPASHYDRGPVANSSGTHSGADRDFSPMHGNHVDNVDSSLANTLATVLSDLQRADSSGSADEFERAKSMALSVLPTFSTGSKLDGQITAIVDQVLESIMDQPLHVIRSMFHSARSFTRDESYMVESVEHQLMSETPLTAPMPPRRRGRRPKLQQQLQPYLARIFSLDPGTAEALAAHLVGCAQNERNAPYYGGFYHTLAFSRNRGRGRGIRVRGRAGRPLSLTLRLLPDGTAARTNGQPVQAVYRTPSSRGSTVNRRVRGGIRGRYRIDRPSSGITHSFPPASEDSAELPEVHCGTHENNGDCTTHFSSTLTNHFNDPHSYTSAYASFMPTHPYGPAVSSHSDDTSTQLRAIRKTSADSDEELDELEEMDEGEEDGADGVCVSGETGRNPTISCEQLASSSELLDDARSHLDRSELSKCATLYQSDTKETINQDTLGEMLEDLGVIVKRIGERAAARRLPCPRESPLCGQPLNLTEYTVEDQQAAGSVASLILGGGKAIRSRSDTAVPAIQLPSMATLASASVGTPASTGGSTPGCLSNAEAHVHSPRLSSAQSQHPASMSGPLGSNQSHTPLSEVNATSVENRLSGSTNLSGPPAEYKSPQNDYHRAPPMWSCESMCCPTSRDLCSVNHDVANNSTDPNDSYSPNLASGHNGEIVRRSGLFTKEDGIEPSQSYHPTDLSTRMLGYTTHSAEASPESSRSNHSPLLNEATVIPSKSGTISSYPVQMSSNAAAMDSLISAVEAVDHLRSLSALGAKYTASLGMSGEDTKHGQSLQHFRLPGYHHYPQPDTSTSPSPISAMSCAPTVGQQPCRADSTSPPVTSHPLSMHNNGPDIFTPPNMPSALNSLLCHTYW
ncbi:hypothetical protein AHF37_02197 [Paragonimus kellicotti]|nr:hypothetical protein AHF37_02197 [Paragonimus kellicotti]